MEHKSQHWTILNVLAGIAGFAGLCGMSFIAAAYVVIATGSTHLAPLDVAIASVVGAVAFLAILYRYIASPDRLGRIYGAASIALLLVALGAQFTIPWGVHTPHALYLIGTGSVLSLAAVVLSPRIRQRAGIGPAPTPMQPKDFIRLGMWDR